MSLNITYGLGGYLPEHPNGNVIEQVVDNLDGTGTRTTYTPEGEVDTVEQLEDLPIVEPEPEVDPAAARLIAAETARREAYDAVLLGKTRTLALLDQAARAGSTAFLAALEG